MHLLDLKPNFESKIRSALYTEFVMQMGQRI